MSLNIRVIPVSSSRVQEVDFENLVFGRQFSDHMFVADYADGKWQDARIVPFGNFEIHPATMALHYGQAVFEGMKASKAVDGTPMLYRPEDHARRINRSCDRMMMPHFPEDTFVEALHLLVGMDQQWIPPMEGSALYLRPFMFATDPFVGVRPSSSYKFIIFTCPVGPYYPRPVKLLAETDYIRAAVGGVGEAKAAGNYAAAMLPTKIAQDNGYDQVIWLDAKERKYVQEVGTMNIFFQIGDKVVTPTTDGAILRGITRDSAMQILKDKGFEVEVRPVAIEEIIEAGKNGTLNACFGTGTAVVVSYVEEIRYRDQVVRLPEISDDNPGKVVKSTINGLRAGTIEDSYGWTVRVEQPRLNGSTNEVTAGLSGVK